MTANQERVVRWYVDRLCYTQERPSNPAMVAAIMPSGLVVCGLPESVERVITPDTVCVYKTRDMIGMNREKLGARNN